MDNGQSERCWPQPRQTMSNSSSGLGSELDSLYGAGTGIGGFNPHHPQQHQHQPMFMDHHQHQSSLDAGAAQLTALQRQQQLQMQQNQYQQQLRPMRRAFSQAYRVGICARRVTEYMFCQKTRPQDNSIEYWRRFVAEFFAPNAKKKWCVSLYEKGLQTGGVFARDGWCCEMCNRKSGWGYEATCEILPRLFKVKYESGIIEEHLYVDMPREYHHSSGHVVLIYGKAVQQTVFEGVRVVRNGQLRIVFSPDLKIRSWEFCARDHEVVLVRRLLIPKVLQVVDAAKKCHASTQNLSSESPKSDLESKCTMLVESAREMAKSLEVPLLNEFGFTKRYVQHLQIAQVFNSLKDVIDHSLIVGTGPIESLAKRPRRTNSPSGFQCRTQHYEHSQQQQPQNTVHNSESEHSSSIQAAMSDGPYATSSMMDSVRASLAQDRGMGQHQQPDP